MKTASIVIGVAAAGLLAGAGYGLYSVGMKQGMGMVGAPVEAPMAGAQSSAATVPDNAAPDKKVLYWHDPMVPGPRFDKPGKSPFMDMQLVPVYADEGGADAGVSINPRTQQNLGVRTAEVVMGSLAPDLQAVGSVAWNERDAAVVSARAAGFVERLFVRAPLDPIAKGQALAELYVPDWVAAQEEFLSLRRRPELAELADGARQRMRLAGMSEAQIAGVETGGAVQARITVTAPISGVLAEIGVREGSSVTAGMAIARINGLSTVWVNAELPEALAARVRPGTAIEARTAAGGVAKGKVAAVLPEVNPITRTIKLRVELPNKERQLVPGMFATLHIKAAGRKDALLIPSEALITTGTRNVVMLALDNGRFMPVEVEAGIDANGQTEIIKGLKAGQRVVVSGQFLVDSEASLKGVATRQGGATEVDAAPAKPGPGADTTFRAEGKVEKIGAGEVTLSHGPIPELNWGPMTMGFRAPPGGMPRNVEAGDPVTFQFRKAADGQFELTLIAPLAGAGASPAPGAKP